MPMGTDPQGTTTVSDTVSEDPRDAIIAQLQAKIAAMTGDVTKAVVSPTVPSVSPTVTASTAPVDTHAATSEDNFTHYVHLADGTVKKMIGYVTRWHESDNPNDPGIPVIGVYPR